MASADDRTAFDKQVLDVYLVGLETELHGTLCDLRRLREGVVALEGERLDCASVHALVGEFDRMLVTNRVLRETLLQLREVAHHLLQGLQTPKRC
jgi:hypothetical protein